MKKYRSLIAISAALISLAASCHVSLPDSNKSTLSIKLAWPSLQTKAIPENTDSFGIDVYNLNGLVDPVQVANNTFDRAAIMALLPQVANSNPSRVDTTQMRDRLEVSDLVLSRNNTQTRVAVEYGLKLVVGRAFPLMAAGCDRTPDRAIGVAMTIINVRPGQATPVDLTLEGSTPSDTCGGLILVPSPSPSPSPTSQTSSDQATPRPSQTPDGSPDQNTTPSSTPSSAASTEPTPSASSSFDPSHGGFGNDTTPSVAPSGNPIPIQNGTFPSPLSSPAYSPVPTATPFLET